MNLDVYTKTKSPDNTEKRKKKQPTENQKNVKYRNTS